MAAPILHDIGNSHVQVLRFAGQCDFVDDVVITPRELVPGARALVAVVAVIAGEAHVMLSAGSDGERYSVAINMVLVGGTSGVRTVEVAALDPLWSMADGSAGWLSIIDFAQKFGLDETIAATDSDGTGLIDRAYLIGALCDAQAECEANIAARYELPLLFVPHILKTALADLARVRLYPRGIPDGVENAARAQRDLLRRVASGAINLPGVAGVAIAESSASDAPIEFHSEGRAYRDNLAGY